MKLRWYLSRDTRPGAVCLVVEQLGAPYWGRAMVVESRRDAHVALPMLEAMVEKEVQSAAFLTEPMRTYDPVETDG